jgi:hypothetical protein
VKKKKCIHCPYFYGNNPLIFQQRDCASYIQLASALSQKGHKLFGSWLNYPGNNGTAPPCEDLSLPGKDFLVLMTTRPPLDGNELEDRKKIRRSGSLLETKLLNALRPHFRVCSRKDVYLDVGYRNEFRAGYGDRRRIEFTMNSQTMGCINVARYMTTITEEDRLITWNLKKGIRTAAYLVYLPEAWKDGPALLDCFSMTGSSSFIWSYLVNRKFSHLLDKPVIAMAEIIVGNIPKHFVGEPSFSLDWDVQLLLETQPIVKQKEKQPLSQAR